MFTSRTRTLALAVTVLAMLALPGAALASSQIQDVTDSPTGGTGATHVEQGWLSADGRCTVFETPEKLLAEDPNSRNDIYERCGNALTLVSTGPAVNADTMANPFMGIESVAANGCVLFYTNDPLTSDDGDTRADLYRRCGATIDKVSQGPAGGNAAEDVTNGNISDDGACVAFLAHEALTSDDTDGLPDIYKRCGNTTTRVSQGPTGGNGTGYPTIEAMTPDGSCVEFTTAEQLVADDTDDQNDAYLRCGSTTTKVSPGNGPNDVSVDALSPDGGCSVIETDERLTSSDTDSQNDVYRICGSTVTEITLGPTGGNADEPTGADGVSRDLSCVSFATGERLTADDTDSTADVYKRCGDHLERVSLGPAGGNAEIHAGAEALSADGRCVLFSTTEHVTADDTDAATDVFQRCGSTTTRVTQGPAGGNSGTEATSVQQSSDGGRVVIQTSERLTSDDTDSAPDLYERSNGETTRITPPDASADHYGSNISAISDDATKVLFSRFDSLSASDTDSYFDLYLATLAPNASTGDANGVGETGATLNGQASGDPAATFHFEYGRTSSYGAATPEGSVPSGAGLHAVSAPVSGLTPGTEYHYRLVVTSAAGTTRTSDGTFKTTGNAPAPGGSQPAAGGKPAPGPGVKAFAGVRIGSGSATVKQGKVAVFVRCPADAQGPCAGRLVLRAKSLKLGTGTFKVAAGKRAKVLVKVSAAGLKALRREHTLNATLVVTAHDARATAVRSSAKLRLS